MQHSGCTVDMFWNEAATKECACQHVVRLTSLLQEGSAGLE